MAFSALRFIAGAGVVIAGLLIGGGGAGIAFTESGDGNGAGRTVPAYTSNSGNKSDSGQAGASNHHHPSLRTPNTGELAMLALPGAAGLLALTLGGGLIGYRQANGSRLVGTPNAVRFPR